MTLKITGGSARGRTLDLPVRGPVRPTSARVREAWFSMIGHDLTGCHFLDAFSGSGVMGLEAWSRGAKVVCIEKDRRTASEIRARAEHLGANLRVEVGDAVELHEVFDIVFADPPYGLDPTPIARALAGHSSEVLGIETRQGETLPALRMVTPRTKRFGGTALHLYRWAL